MSELWWGKPVQARRFHVFDGEETLANSLCGNWALSWNSAEPYVTDEDEFKDGQDCKECSRKAGVLNE